jgi:hypothetical protein
LSTRLGGTGSTCSSCIANETRLCTKPEHAPPGSKPDAFVFSGTTERRKWFRFPILPLPGNWNREPPNSGP